jgi:hypothetical protein
VPVRRTALLRDRHLMVTAYLPLVPPGLRQHLTAAATLFAFDARCNMLRNHHRGQVSVGTRHFRDDRGIHDAEAVHPNHPGRTACGR